MFLYPICLLLRAIKCGSLHKISFLGKPLTKSNFYVQKLNCTSMRHNACFLYPCICEMQENSSDISLIQMSCPYKCLVACTHWELVGNTAIKTYLEKDPEAKTKLLCNHINSNHIIINHINHIIKPN